MFSRKFFEPLNITFYARTMENVRDRECDILMN